MLKSILHTDINSAPSQKSDELQLLEDFIFNNSDLEQLENIIEKFNIFLSLGIINEETRHSNFLAWLLTPSETHGMGDYFLKSFLKFVAINNQNDLKTVDVFDIDSWDFDATSVYKEWHNIDVLIIDETLKFLCVIENKVDSKEHSDQLTRYKNIIDTQYPNYKKLFIYLTVNGERPEKDDIYISINYSQIAELISKLLVSKQSQLSDEILLFIEHYLEMIKRFIMEESEVQAICEKIYKKHKKALDLIIKYKPDIYTDVCDVIVEIIEEKKEMLIKDHHSKSYIRFIPNELDFIPKRGDGWTRSKRILMFEIQNYDKTVSLALMIGPGEQTIRQTIYNLAKDDAKFNGTWAAQLPTKWSTIYKLELEKIKNLDGKSRETIKEILQQKLNTFLSGDYIHLSKSIQSLREKLSDSNI